MKGLLGGAFVAVLLTAGIAKGDTLEQTTEVFDQDENVSISNGSQSVVVQDGRITISNGGQTLSVGSGDLTPTTCATPRPTPEGGSSRSVVVNSNGRSVSIVDGVVSITNADGTCLVVGGSDGSTATPTPTGTLTPTSTPTPTGTPQTPTSTPTLSTGVNASDLRTGADLHGANLADRDLRNATGTVRTSPVLI